MTPESTATLIDRERRRHELAVYVYLLATYAKAARHSVMAAKLGHNPADAALAVIEGDEALGLPGALPGLLRRLYAAHDGGWRRAGLLTGLPQASDYYAAPTVLSLSRTLNAFAASRARVTERARQLVRDVAGKVREGLSNIAETGAAAVEAVRGWWKKSGLVKTAETDKAHRTETDAIDEAVQAYNIGSDSGYAADAGDRVTGFVFTATMDDRTTEVCRVCDGVRLPKDHPWWMGHTPRMHHRCRSLRVPLLGAFYATPEKLIPSVTAAPGFGYGLQ